MAGRVEATGGDGGHRVEATGGDGGHRVARLGASAGARPADLVLRNGRIYQGAGLDGSPIFAPALAVSDGRIVAAGPVDDVAALAGDHTVVVDLDGRTVVPGLIDSHLHMVRAGLSWTDEVFWYEVASREEALALLDAQARERPPGTWLRVIGGWHPGQFAERTGPTRQELTTRYPDHPVYVQLLYEHAVLNDAALAAAGIVAGVADPERGAFDRHPQTGEPTGTVRGVGAFMHCLGCMPGASPDAQVEGTAQLMATLNAWESPARSTPAGSA